MGLSPAPARPAKSGLARFGFDERTDHRQSKQCRDVAARILPDNPDIVCMGVWRIFLLLLDIYQHRNWIRLRIEALANTGVQECTFCQGNDVRLILGQRYGIGLGGQIDTAWPISLNQNWPFFSGHVFSGDSIG